jgi:Sec-independent protein translocase protein TatA
MVVLFAALLVLGPDKLSERARKIGNQGRTSRCRTSSASAAEAPSNRLQNRVALLGAAAWRTGC